VTALRRLVAVARADDVPALEGRTVTVAGRRIAIFRTLAGFRATDAECPHRGGPLADGLVGDDCVTCPLHNWRIDLSSGEVVAGGQGSVPVHPVRERDGWLYLELDG
jgi:nitrite reductase (NADH) small subunit